MIYKQEVQLPSTKKIVEHQIARCIKCGNDDINLNEYEDNFGFISTVTCKNKECNNTARANAGLVVAIKSWNNKNDIPTVITNKKALIEQTKLEIIELLKLFKQRKANKQ